MIGQEHVLVITLTVKHCVRVTLNHQNPEAKTAKLNSVTKLFFYFPKSDESQ